MNCGARGFHPAYERNRGQSPDVLAWLFKRRTGQPQALQEPLGIFIALERAVHRDNIIRQVKRLILPGFDPSYFGRFGLPIERQRRRQEPVRSSVCRIMSKCGACVVDRFAVFF